MKIQNLNATKRMVILITVVVILLFSMGLTFDEAQQMYYDLNCSATPAVTSDGCVIVKCDTVQEMVKMYVVEWDTIEPPVEPPIEPPPDTCVPEWCGLPIQDCDLPPLTDGTDSCGDTCSKPSPEWPNCLLNGKMVSKDFGG